MTVSKKIDLGYISLSDSSMIIRRAHQKYCDLLAHTNYTMPDEESRKSVTAYRLLAISYRDYLAGLLNDLDNGKNLEVLQAVTWAMQASETYGKAIAYVNTTLNQLDT